MTSVAPTRASVPVERPGSGVSEVQGAASSVLRVMHVVYALEPGGMEYGVLKLVNGLDPHRVRSSICSTRPGGRLRALAAPGVPVFELRRRDGNDPGLVWALYRLFRRERPHIVHTHAWGTLLEGLVAARCAGVPVVVHGEHGTMQVRLHQRWLQRLGWAWADQVMSVSSRLAERMAAETGFPLERIVTLRNGVDLLRFGHVDRGRARAELGLDQDRTIIGTVGRLVPVKDQASLVEALGLLRRDGLSPMAVLAGEGPLQNALAEQAAALGLSGQVRLLGHRQDVDRVLAALDVFVLPSLSEGLSNTVLEAMATGLPVVATRVGGMDEIVEAGVTGLLIPSGQPQALADALGTLLRDPACRLAMGTASRLRVEQAFALTETTRQYEALYRRLADARLRSA